MNRYIVGDLFVSSFLHKYHDNPDKGLAEACQRGHRDLAHFMILKGADPTSCWNQQHCHPVK